MTREQRIDEAVRQSMPATIKAFKLWHKEGNLSEQEIVNAADCFKNKIRRIFAVM